MKLKLTNLHAALMGDFWNTVKCWIARFRTRDKKMSKLWVRIDRITLGHAVGDHPRTKARIDHLKLSGIADIQDLSENHLHNILPSDDKIIVGSDYKVINGNGRVGALKMAGFKGWLEVYKTKETIK